VRSNHLHSNPSSLVAAILPPVFVIQIYYNGIRKLIYTIFLWHLPRQRLFFW
ncbi:hypothetical protein J6590_096590, partial [Homalodisca vitripennis]